MTRREQPVVEIYTVIELADELIDDLQAEVEKVDKTMVEAKLKSDRGRCNPRRVARIYSEGGVDHFEGLLEEANEEFDEEEEGGSGGGSGGGPARKVWETRTKLAGIYANMRKDRRFADAMLNMRHEVSRAYDASFKLRNRAKSLRADWQMAYDAMADLQNAMADGMSSVRVNKVPDWGNDMSFADRVKELRIIADAATGKSYQVTPSPSMGGEDD